MVDHTRRSERGLLLRWQMYYVVPVQVPVQECVDASTRVEQRVVLVRVPVSF